MIDEWRRFLLGHAEEWRLPDSGRWSYVFYNNYHPHITTLNLLWFHDGDSSPSVITKLFRDPEVPNREFANLARAHALAPACTPEPLTCIRRGPFCELWMRGVPGERVVDFHRYPKAALRSLAELVSRMHRAFAGDAASCAADRFERAVKSPLAAVASFGESLAAREGCGRLAAAATPQWICRLPVVPQHGDLYLGNLLSDRGRWYVVDWEAFGIVDLPFYDVVTLLVSALRESGKDGLQRNGGWSGSAREFVGTYRDTMALSLEDIGVLLPLALVNWFYLQLCDGRQEFAGRMYRTIVDYFENAEAWQRSFIG